MNKNHTIALAIFFLLVLSITAFSYSKINQVTDDISLEEIKDCETIWWNEPGHWYGNCYQYYNATICVESLDDIPNGTDYYYNETNEKNCYFGQESYEYLCVAGTKNNFKSKEVCKEREYKVSVEEPSETKNYKLSYGDWGKCSYETEGETVVITCDSRFDGNNDGICSSGESCTQFRVTKGNIQTLIKNSRDDFVENDKSFFLEKLKMEVE